MYCVILVTAKDKEEAEKIARGLVENKLIACANIVPAVQSVFFWDGKVCAENEVLLIMKSKKVLMKKIIAAVKSLHSYSVPEIIALPILDGNADYLKWVSDVTSIKGSRGKKDE